jgi:hypothetical protein
MVEENALQASLLDRLSSTIGGEENTVNNSMKLLESVEQDDVQNTVISLLFVSNFRLRHKATPETMVLKRL